MYGLMVNIIVFLTIWVVVIIVFLSCEAALIRIVDIIFHKSNVIICIGRKIVDIIMIFSIAVQVIDFLRIYERVTQKYKNIRQNKFLFQVQFMLGQKYFEHLFKNLRFLGDARIRSTPNSGKGTLTDLFELLISKFSSQKLRKFIK